MGTLKGEESKFAQPGLAASSSNEPMKRPTFTNTKKPVEDVILKRGEMGTQKAEEPKQPSGPSRFGNSNRDEESKGGAAEWRSGAATKPTTQPDAAKPSGFTRGTTSQAEPTKPSGFTRGPAT